MLIGCVIEDEVNEDANSTLVCLRNQLVPILKRSVFRSNVHVIRYVVSKIGIGRGEKRRNPKRVDTQLSQVIQSRGNSIQITDAVPVRILEASQVNFVNDSMVVPVCGA